MFTKYINDIKAIFCDKIAQVLMAVFSIIFGLVKSLSEFVYDKDEVNVDLVQSGLYAFICYLLLNIAYYIITRDYSVKPIEIKSPRKLWWTFFAIFLLSYTICWLTYWPGNVYIDNWNIAQRGMSIADQHPIIYCAFIVLLTNISIWLGSINYSIIIYTFLQILIMSLFMSSLYFFIFQRKIPKAIKTILLLVCILLPIYALFTISNTKDIYWALCMAGFIILLYRLNISQKQNRRFWILFNIYTLGIVLIRNNGIYIILPTLVCMLFLFPHIKKKLLVSLGGVLLSIVLTSIWVKSLDVQPLFKEKVGIPIQQIAAVVKKEGNITSEQKEFISKMLPIDTIKKRYNPYCVDTIKWRNSGFNSKFLNEHSFEFLNIWKNIIAQNFKISVVAYLQAVYWYWAPNEREKLDLIIGVVSHKNQTLMQWLLKKNYVEHEFSSSRIKKELIKYYESAYGFWHEGSLFWILMVSALLYYIKRRNFKDLIIYLPIFLLWCTLMIAAPIHSFRYVLSYIYILPLYIALLFIDAKERDIDVQCNILDHKNWSNEIRKYVRLFIYLCIILYTIWYFTIGHPVNARIDVSTAYTKDYSFIVIDNDNELLSEPEWMQKFNRRGVIIQQRDKKYTCILIPFENTNIDVVLRGPDERDAIGKRIEKWVKYTDFRINGEKILSEPVEVWHDKPFNYVLKAEKGKLYKISFKWKKK